MEDVLRLGVKETLGLTVTDWASFPSSFTPLAANHEPFLRYLPPLGPASSYEGLVVVVRVKRAGLPLRVRALRDALRGRPLSLGLQAIAAPLGLGILSARDDLVRAAADAMVDAGIPRVVTETDGGGHGGVASALHRYWRVSS